MTFRREVVVTESDVVTALSESLHLIVYLLGDTAMGRKAMIYQEQNL
jgi:hypothetical protein